MSTGSAENGAPICFSCFELILLKADSFIRSDSDSIPITKGGELG